MALSLPYPNTPNDGDAFLSQPIRSNINAITQAIQSFDGSQVAAGTIQAAALAPAANPITRGAETISNFVASGVVWSATGGFLANMSSGVVYVAGARVLVNTVTGKTFAASSDTYVDVDTLANLYYLPVGNAATPPTLTANSQRIAKIVTNGSTITAVVQAGFDANGVAIYSTTPYAGASASTGYTNLGQSPSSVVYNGNRSYTCVFNNVDLTPSISPGMRIRTQRTVSSPTQSSSLNGTTQFWSKTSPAGMAFTDNFTVMGWVKLTSYGVSGAIQGRMDSTSANGWAFRVGATGQVEIAVQNAGATNYRVLTSYQAIPLNKWVHVAQTWAAGVSNIYIDGISASVMAAVTSGTAPTVATVGTDYAVGRPGAFNGQYFPGKVAQAAVFSTVLSQATIQSYISQGLAGTETSLISAYSFNNTANDLNSTSANNLTANGSAVATNADSPFGGQGNGAISATLDYGIVQSVNFSTNTTVVIQLAEGCTIPSSGGISAVSYSSNKVPYLFPSSSDKWTFSYSQGAASGAGVTGSAWSLGTNFIQLMIPAGVWDLSTLLVLTVTGGDGYCGLSTNATGVSDTDLISRQYTSTAATRLLEVVIAKTIVTTSATVYYGVVNPSGSTAVSFRGRSDDVNQYSKILLKNAYL